MREVLQEESQKSYEEVNIMVNRLDSAINIGEPYTQEELKTLREARAVKTIANMQHRRELWRLACEYDQIPPESSFVVFSNDNPFAKELNNGTF